MKWFNGNPGPPACEEDAHTRAEVPVGEMCGWCGEAITAEQSGFLIPHLFAHVFTDTAGASSGESEERPWHRECFIRSIIGSVGHQLRTCSCYGGNAGDIEGHTKRQAAIAAFTLFENRSGLRSRFDL